MPRYCFECEKCKKNWEAHVGMTEISDHVEYCKCGAKANRDYSAESAFLIPPQKTLGSRADKNSSRMSSDQKQRIIETNRSGEKL